MGDVKSKPLDYATPPIDNDRNPPWRRVRFASASVALFAVAIGCAKASFDLIHSEWPIATIPFVPFAATIGIIAMIFGVMALFQAIPRERPPMRYRER
jgi:TRAP-type C4-dicarboxylate transport system permease small subunit